MEEEVRGGPTPLSPNPMESILTQFHVLVTHLSTNICAVHPHICMGLGV